MKILAEMMLISDYIIDNLFLPCSGIQTSQLLELWMAVMEKKLTHVSCQCVSIYLSVFVILSDVECIIEHVY